MSTTTFDLREPARLLGSLSRLAVAALVAIVLCMGAFAVGRFSAPTHTGRSVLTVPVAQSDALLNCHAGRPC